MPWGRRRYTAVFLEDGLPHDRMIQEARRRALAAGYIIGEEGAVERVELKLGAVTVVDVAVSVELGDDDPLGDGSWMPLLRLANRRRP